MVEETGRHSHARLTIHGQDRTLAARIAAGDRAAFERLVHDYYPMSYQLAFRMLTDPCDAEEVTQDAFLKVHRAMGSFRGQSSLRTWILRIVMRLSLNRRRDRSRSNWHRLGLHRGTTERMEHPPEAVAPAAGTPEGQYLSSEAREQILRQIDQLPEGMRQVLLLNSLEELSYEEISHILDIPVGTVSSRLHAARKKLADALGLLNLP